MHENKPATASNAVNKKWEVKRNERGKTYECARCGYVSERKSNVGRHFRRFHSELEKYKICICKKRFITKGEYYEHCNKVHRHLRHSWYISTLKYKFRKIKSKSLKIELIERESNYPAIKCNKKRGLRSSPRLQSLYKKGILNDEKSIINDISKNNKIKKTLEEKENNKENVDSNNELKPNVIREKISSTIDSKSLTHLSEFHIITPLTHLPLKKRFGNFSKRKYLGNFKNFNNNDNNNNKSNKNKNNVSEKDHIENVKIKCENLNNNEVQINNLNLTKINEQHRAFISQIDFDELNAILNLKYLKNCNH